MAHPMQCTRCLRTLFFCECILCEGCGRISGPAVNQVTRVDVEGWVPDIHGGQWCPGCADRLGPDGTAGPCPDVVRIIRSVCSEEFRVPEDFPFFRMEERPGESADDRLWRLFTQEKEIQLRLGRYTDDHEVILVLCYG